VTRQSVTIASPEAGPTDTSNGVSSSTLDQFVVARSRYPRHAVRGTTFEKVATPTTVVAVPKIGGHRESGAAIRVTASPSTASTVPVASTSVTTGAGDIVCPATVLEGF